ncbi:hypothetical protein M758_4G033600 [Ceratodon purpureus]|nr:hypothetical protein M758_4G033600 [Ceratodon purpureus]
MATLSRPTVDNASQLPQWPSCHHPSQAAAALQQLLPTAVGGQPSTFQGTKAPSTCKSTSPTPLHSTLTYSDVLPCWVSQSSSSSPSSFSPSLTRVSPTHVTHPKPKGCTFRTSGLHSRPHLSFRAPA